MTQKENKIPAEKPHSPKHPGDDQVMPPYTPAGVPEPEGEPAAHQEREGDPPPPSGFPPKRDA